MKQVEETILYAAALILFGATAHALLQLSVSRKSEETFDWLDFVIALVIAAFSGTLFGIVSAFWWEDPLAIYAVSGVGAFLGIKGVNSLSDALLDILTARMKGRGNGSD